MIIKVIVIEGFQRNKLRIPTMTNNIYIDVYHNYLIIKKLKRIQEDNVIKYTISLNSKEFKE